MLSAYYPTPKTRRAVATCLLILPGSWNAPGVDAKTIARAAAYVLHAALEDVDTQQKGIIAIFWPARAKRLQFNREFIFLMARSIKGARYVKGAMPVRLSGVHICQPRTFLEWMFPLLQFVLGERLSQRIRLHIASDMDDLLEGLREPY
jgi:hypothetical protein